jgi:dTDP-4-dehydrorhamnose 3,5-epimerase
MDQIIHPSFKELKIIKGEKGDVLHVFKNSDIEFDSFGEAYFSTVHHGKLKGWKRHTRMFCNLTVPVGAVKFRIISPDQKFFTFIISSDNYGRLSIPPGCWFSFEGIGESLNLLLNIANIEHDPLESENLPEDAFELSLFD